MNTKALSLLADYGIISKTVYGVIMDELESDMDNYEIAMKYGVSPDYIYNVLSSLEGLDNW